MMKLLPYTYRLLTGAALFSVLLTACGGEPEQSPQPSAALSSVAPAPTVTAAVASPLPSPSPAAVSGLTGLPVATAPLPRPLAVMINNAPAARPQSGLTNADILYEVLAEGGITRLIAVYQSAPDIAKIGPVRSIRPYLIDIGESYGAVTAHAGGSPDAYAILQRQHKDDLDEIGRAGAFFWRDKSRKAPHNLYTSLDKLRAGIAKLGYGDAKNTPGYTFLKEGEQPEKGENAAGFTVHYLLKSYTVSYKYDSASGVYGRLMNGKPHTDLGTGKPVTAANVIVMEANHKVLDDVGRLSVNLEQGGRAMLFQRGQALSGRWARGAGDIIRFVKDGKEAPLVPGVTHILIVPASPPLDSHITVDAG
ncbi:MULTISPECIES: DUF3048 domain-containing protein [Paenibacillus]|uniref:DUF3048 domain-containing protein n=1 Tax=Paenibacillus TaxID=44249 RepID=UPI00292D0D9A|nr:MULTISPECIES: DUF3048 domain-containing protein [Paenibacillus]